MSIKKTLLEIVKSILNDMESEDVNSIGDTEEAYMIAGVVENVYYDLIADRHIPEHQELVKLTALSDTDFPTHFYYPENLKHLTTVWYDTSDDSSFDYKEIKWLDPLDFIKKSDSVSSNYDSVLDKNGGTTLKIRNNKQPEWYTSFDDYYLVFDSYDSTVDTTLQESKSRSLGVIYPVFSKTDSHVPDLDGDMFPRLIREATSMCQSLYKGGSDPKVEQAARRHKVFIQNDRYRTKRDPKWVAYGRRTN